MWSTLGDRIKLATCEIRLDKEKANELYIVDTVELH